jgi:hypothetical protein
MTQFADKLHLDKQTIDRVEGARQRRIGARRERDANSHVIGVGRRPRQHPGAEWVAGASGTRGATLIRGSALFRAVGKLGAAGCEARACSRAYRI